MNRQNNNIMSKTIALMADILKTDISNITDAGPSRRYRHVRHLCSL